MSQMNPYSGSMGQEMVMPPKTSGLAITSLVMSMIFCCPVTTILGPILGLIALFTIGSNPMRKGRGIALAAIVIGIVMTAAQVAGISWGWKRFWVPIMEGPGPALQMGYAGDIPGFMNSFHIAGTAPTTDDAQAFLNELTTRYGAYRSTRFDESRQPSQQPGSQTQTFFYVIEFENATVSAEAEILFSDPAIGVIVKPTYVTIEDRNLGDLTYPTSASAPQGTN